MTTYDQDQETRRARAQQVALFRYQSIRQPGSRIDTTVLELAVALKRENPDRTAAQVARILSASSGWAPSESTLLRLFHRRDLMGPAAGDAPAVFGNGSAYVDSWLLRACGKLGIRLIHSTPHRPQGRGKIERWFRGVREQFLVEVADSTTDELAERGLTPAAALLELNALFTAWVETVYHHRVHTETGQAPLQRWDAGWQAAGHGPAMASADALTEAFLWSQLRTVTKTATVCRCTAGPVV